MNTSTTNPVRPRSSPAGRYLLCALAGLVTGAVLTGLALWKFMPRLMIVVHESRYADVDETCAELTKAIQAAGWNSPATRNLNKALSAQGVELAMPVRIVELCQANYAREVLTTNPEMSTLMPCAWGVYRGADGKVYIAGLNIGLMGRLFGGNIAKVMGRQVANDEARMLRSVTRESSP